MSTGEEKTSEEDEVEGLCGHEGKENEEEEEEKDRGEERERVCAGTWYGRALRALGERVSGIWLAN